MKAVVKYVLLFVVGLALTVIAVRLKNFITGEDQISDRSNSTTVVSNARQIVSNARQISEREFGKNYPFKVDGELRCIDSAVILKVGDSIYPVNGTAQSKYKDQAQPLESIWKDNPDIPGSKVSLSTILSEGQKLCQ